MTRGIWVPGLMMLALAAAGGEEPAPLEGSKRELRALHQEQATKDAPARLTEGLPHLDTPTPGAPLFEMPKPEKAESERKKKPTKKNWLVDGVNQLEKEAKAKEPQSSQVKRDIANDSEAEKLDSSDPDYLLKLYHEQEKETQAKNAGKSSDSSRPDPLAPFLQGWLHGLPTEKRGFEGRAQRSEVGAAVAPSAGAGFEPRSGLSTDFALGGRENAAPVQANPFLQGLELPSPHDALEKPGPMFNSPGLTAPRLLPALAPRVEPVAPTRPVEKKPLLPPPSEDKKYFPQLRKF